MLSGCTRSVGARRRRAAGRACGGGDITSTPPLPRPPADTIQVMIDTKGTSHYAHGSASSTATGDSGARDTGRDIHTITTSNGARTSHTHSPA